MRILIASDAWFPQVNGVVRTLSTVCQELERLGHEVLMFTRENFRTFPLPSYPEIKLAFPGKRVVSNSIQSFGPEAIHIATEGPIGWAVRKFCMQNHLPFTTGFHTKFADYSAKRIPLPGIKALSYKVLKLFHRDSSAVMAASPSMARELRAEGFQNVVA